MGTSSTYKPEGSNVRKLVTTEEEAALITPIVQMLLPLPKYQNLIATLRNKTQSPVGVANFVTGQESGELLDAIIRAAFPSSTGLVYQGDEGGYDMDAEAVFGTDPAQAMARFAEMLQGAPAVMDNDYLKRMEAMRGQFTNKDGKPDTEIGNFAVDQAYMAQVPGGGGGGGGIPGFQAPAAAAPASPLANIQALIERKTKLVARLSDVRLQARSVDRLADPKQYNLLVTLSNNYKALIAQINIQLPKLSTHNGRPVYDNSGFISFEGAANNTMLKSLDNLIYPDKMNLAIDKAAQDSMKKGGAGAQSAAAMNPKQRQAVATAMTDKLIVKLKALRPGSKQSMVTVIDQILAILEKGYSNIMSNSKELKHLRDEMERTLQSSQKIWIIQNVTDSGLVNRPHGAQDDPSKSPDFLGRTLLKGYMSKKETVSGDRCIVFISAEPINFGYAGIDPVILPTGVDDVESDAIIKFFLKLWAKKMRDAGVPENEMNAHMKLRFNELETMKMLIAGVPHKTAILRLNDAFLNVYDPENKVLDGKRMADEVARIGNDAIAAGAKGLTAHEGGISWADYIYKDDPDYQWGGFCDSVMRSVSLAKKMWDQESKMRLQLDQLEVENAKWKSEKYKNDPNAAKAKADIGLKIFRISRKIKQIGEGAKQLLSMPHFLILYGEAASGKSSFAEAISNLLGFRMRNVDFGQTRGMYAGQTEQNSAILINAIKSSSNVVFRMDEFDGQVASNQDAALNSHNAAMVQQLLTFFNDNVGLLIRKNIFVIATSNNPGYIRSQLLSRGVPMKIPLPLNKKGYMQYLVNAPERLSRQGGGNLIPPGVYHWNGKDCDICSNSEVLEFTTNLWKGIDVDKVAAALDAHPGGKLDFRMLASLLRLAFGEFANFLITGEMHRMWQNDRQAYEQEYCTNAKGEVVECKEPEIDGFNLDTESLIRCIDLTTLRPEGSYGGGEGMENTNILPNFGVWTYSAQVKAQRNKAKEQAKAQGELFDDTMFKPQAPEKEEEEDLLTPAGTPEPVPVGGEEEEPQGKKSSSTRHFIRALVKDGIVVQDRAGRMALVTPRVPLPPGVMRADAKPMVSEQPQGQGRRRYRTLEERVGIFMSDQVVLAPCNLKMVL